MTEVVVDASAIVDLLIGGPVGAAVRERLRDDQLHAPAHLDSEVLSALGRLQRGGQFSESDVLPMLVALARAPIVRHPMADLLAGSWARRARVRLADALYLELASRLGLPLVTTDLRLRREPGVQTVEIQ